MMIESSIEVIEESDLNDKPINNETSKIEVQQNNSGQDDEETQNQSNMTKLTLQSNYLDEISKKSKDSDADAGQNLAISQQLKDMKKSIEIRPSVKVVRNSGHYYDSHYILSK